MTERQQDVVVPDAVMEKLDAVRGRTLKVRIGTAVTAALGVLMAAMALAMLVDWLATLYDSRWRLVLTYSALGVAAVTFCIWVVAAWRQYQQVTRAAIDVDREVPQLEQRWSTIAQLGTSLHATNVHPAMYRQVAREASAWSPRINPDQVVSLDRWVLALWGMLAITAVLGTAVILDSHQTVVLLRRFWAPGSSISATELADTPGNVVVARGEPLEIAAQMGGALVSQATLFVEPDGRESESITLLPKGDDGKRLSHQIRSVETPFRYRLRAGDGQTPWHSVDVADRPELGDVQITVIPPAYTGQQSEMLDKFPRKISTLHGSRLQLAIKSKAAVEKVELRLGGERSETLSVDKQGWYRWETTLAENFAMSPILTEKHGLTNRRPPVCEITCRRDIPPAVTILQPDDEVAVRPDDTIPITFAAKDDVAIGSAELLVFDESLGGEPLPIATIPIPLGEQQGKANIHGAVDLDLSQFDLANGAQLSFAIRVREDRSTSADVDGDRGERIPNAIDDATAAQVANAVASSTEKPARDADRASEHREQATGNATSVTSTQSGTSTPVNENQETALANHPTRTDSRPATKASDPDVDTAASAPEQDTQAVPRSTADATSTNSDTLQQEPGNRRTATSDRQGILALQRSGSQSNATGASSPGSSTSSTPQMQTGYLAVPQAQSASSKRMRLTVDDTVTSLDGQRRFELEVAISPHLEEIDVALGKAQQLSRSVLEDVEKNRAWKAKHGRDTGTAEAHIVDALNAVDKLQSRTRGTLYAFIGLQLVDIGHAHIHPARQEFWKALQTEGEIRIEAVRNGWQHTGRARDLLERLTGQFERARREYALAETVDEIKKMYQVYVDNALALMREAGESSPYSRKIAELELDEEYLARLKEVLEMRNEMRAELARILADDPRLLRRFLDAERNRHKVLRIELADLVERQAETNRKTKAWNVVERKHRPELAAILLQRHVNGIQAIAVSAADLYDRFYTWLPLNGDSQHANLVAAGELLEKISTATREVSASAGRFAGSRTGVSPSATREEASSRERRPNAREEANTDGNDGLDAIVTEAGQLYDLFKRLEIVLSQIGMRDGQEEIAGFATTRLVETRRLVEKSSAWIRQLKYHKSGNYHRAAEIEQYQLAMATDALAGKLADLEPQFSAMLQIDEGTLPKPIADKVRGLLAALDEQATPNQLAAVHGLRRNQLSRAASRQAAALEGLKLAGSEYDQMIQLVIAELDKFPVQDPIASLLDDPTLDELLAQLEQEVPIREVLGIPCRPTNLQIIDDWLRTGNGGMGSGGIGYNPNPVLMNKLREQQLKRQRAIEQAFRKALARATNASDAKVVVVKPPVPARPTVDWNRLVSQLGDDLQQGRNTAPPERYRRAIEQYFRQISRSNDQQPAPQP